MWNGNLFSLEKVYVCPVPVMGCAWLCVFFYTPSSSPLEIYAFRYVLHRLGHDVVWMPGTYVVQTHTKATRVGDIKNSVFLLRCSCRWRPSGCVNLMQYLWSTILFLFVTTCLCLVSPLRPRHRVYPSTWLWTYDVYEFYALDISNFREWILSVFISFYALRHWAPNSTGVNGLFLSFGPGIDWMLIFENLSGFRLCSPWMWHSVKTLYLQLRLNAEHTNFGRRLCAASHSPNAFRSICRCSFKLEVDNFRLSVMS